MQRSMTMVSDYLDTYQKYCREKHDKRHECGQDLALAFQNEFESDQALKKLAQPKCKVIRNNKVEEIPSEELVVDDLIIIEEDLLIPADATIIQSNDFTVNESVLTGDSF